MTARRKQRREMLRSVVVGDGPRWCRIRGCLPRKIRSTSARRAERSRSMWCVLRSRGWQVIDPAGIECALFALWLLRLVGFGTYAKEL